MLANLLQIIEISFFNYSTTMCNITCENTKILNLRKREINNHIMTEKSLKNEYNTSLLF